MTELPRALVVSTIADEQETPMRMGSASYSYYYVYQAFAPLLRRYGTVVETVRPEERLDELVRAGTGEGARPTHLGFLPLDAFHRTSLAPNVAFPFWDFPDLPSSPLGGKVHNNWAAIANELDLILTSSEFTRDTFVRAGVRTPIAVVPVPVRQSYLDAPPFDANQRTTIDCRAHMLMPVRSGVRGASRATDLYHRYLRPRLSRRATDTVSVAAHAFSALRGELRELRTIDCESSTSFELSGIVHTTVLNPFDQRKNWQDLLTAYLFALADCDDATLVMKLALPPDRVSAGVNKVLGFYRRLGLAHRCRVVLISDYLSDAQMLELVRGTTWYLNSSRAEGACLPLQDFLAAGRPAVAPRHTAIADYFGEGAGFVVESHPEPAAWPQDPEGRCTTTWHRLVWTSLRDAIRESYEIAKSRPQQYESLAMNARATMSARAGSEVVWPRLKSALDSVGHAL